MSDKFRVLIASRSRPAIDSLRECLAGQADLECTTRLVQNGHADPLHGLPQMPDVLLLRFDPHHLAELAALAEMDAASRPPLIVIGPPASPEVMRLAVRSGAKDFLVEPLQSDELISALDRIRAASKPSARSTGSIDVVIGAAGGVGTSFIACNLAHLTVAAARRSCLLLDLDLSYAPLAHFLDIKPERGLAEALEAIETLDEVALQGYVTKHHSGLHVMSTVPKTTVLARDLQADRLAALLHVLATQYRHVIVDSPHHIDALNATVFGMARSVLVVLEQSVLHVKNASRLLHVLTRELSLPRERIRVVLNRYVKRAAVQVEDVRRTLDCDKILTIPNHYKLSQDSIDTAVPLFNLDKDADVVQSLLDLQSELDGTHRVGRPGLLSRLSALGRKS